MCSWSGNGTPALFVKAQGLGAVDAGHVNAFARKLNVWPLSVDTETAVDPAVAPPGIAIVAS